MKIIDKDTGVSMETVEKFDPPKCLTCGAVVPFIGGIEEWVRTELGSETQKPTGRVWCSELCWEHGRQAIKTVSSFNA